MTIWKFVAVAICCVTASVADAQDGVDWGGIMQTEAMGSVMQEAAREGAGRQRLPKARARPQPTAARSRANCAKARRWQAEGVQHPSLPKALSLCQQLGY